MSPMDSQAVAEKLISRLVSVGVSPAATPANVSKNLTRPSLNACISRIAEYVDAENAFTAEEIQRFSLQEQHGLILDGEALEEALQHQQQQQQQQQKTMHRQTDQRQQHKSSSSSHHRSPFGTSLGALDDNLEDDSLEEDIRRAEEQLRGLEMNKAMLLSQLEQVSGRAKQREGKKRGEEEEAERRRAAVVATGMQINLELDRMLQQLQQLTDLMPSAGPSTSGISGSNISSSSSSSSSRLLCLAELTRWLDSERRFSEALEGWIQSRLKMGIARSNQKAAAAGPPPTATPIRNPPSPAHLTPPSLTRPAATSATPSSRHAAMSATPRKTPSSCRRMSLCSAKEEWEAVGDEEDWEEEEEGGEGGEGKEGGGGGRVMVETEQQLKQRQQEHQRNLQNLAMMRSTSAAAEKSLVLIRVRRAEEAAEKVAVEKQLAAAAKANTARRDRGPGGGGEGFRDELGESRNEEAEQAGIAGLQSFEAEGRGGPGGDLLVAPVDDGQRFERVGGVAKRMILQATEAALPSSSSLSSSLPSATTSSTPSVAAARAVAAPGAAEGSSSVSSSATPATRASQATVGFLRQKAQELEERVSSMCRQLAAVQDAYVYEGDYDLKIKRQDAFMHKINEAIRFECEQMSRHLALLLLLSSERANHVQTAVLLRSIAMLLKQLSEAANERISRYAALVSPPSSSSSTTQPAPFANLAAALSSSESRERAPRNVAWSQLSADLLRAVSKHKQLLDVAVPSALRDLSKQADEMMDQAAELEQHLLITDTSTCPVLSHPEVTTILDQARQAIDDVFCKEVENLQQLWKEKQKNLELTEHEAKVRNAFVDFFLYRERLDFYSSAGR